MTNPTGHPMVLTAHELTGFASSWALDGDYEDAARYLTAANDLIGGWRGIRRWIRRALGR